MAGLKFLTGLDEVQTDSVRSASSEQRNGPRRGGQRYWSTSREARAPGSAEGRDAHRPSSAQHLPHLTRREKQVLHLIVSGRLSKQIAAELEISPRTVELHRSRIMHKMGASNVAQLMRLVMCPGCAQRFAAITA